jgi:hypothetical protein
MSRIPSLALLGVLACSAALAQPTKPRLETVSYTDLGKLVRANKGKVVVVYFWSDG